VRLADGGGSSRDSHSTAKAASSHLSAPTQNAICAECPEKYATYMWVLKWMPTKALLHLLCTSVWVCRCVWVCVCVWFMTRVPVCIYVFLAVFLEIVWHFSSCFAPCNVIWILIAVFSLHTFWLPLFYCLHCILLGCLCFIVLKQLALALALSVFN